MFDQFITSLHDYHIMEILFGLGILLVLIDYIFPTDWPAHVGYVCFAFAFFMLLPFGMLGSILGGIGVWILLFLGHRFVFGHFLKNAEETNDTDPSSEINATEGPQS